MRTLIDNADPGQSAANTTCGVIQGRPFRSLLLLLAVVLGGCSEVKIPWVYRIDIQQGNVITQAQLAKLELGMEQSKVLFILGTPLVADAFNLDRWDYYYSYEPGNGQRVQRIISVFFDENGLAQVGGDVRAASGPIIVEERRDELVTVPPGLNDDSIFAFLTPGFLSNRKKTIDLSKLEKSSDQTTAAPQQEGFEAPEIEITDADRLFLKKLLKEYGKTGSPPTGSTAVTTAGSGPGDAEVTDEQNPADEEGIFSRWAKRLGLKDDDKTPQPVTPEPQSQPTSTSTDD